MRRCDQVLRARYGPYSASVIEQNSLYSAMTINGALVALAMSEMGFPLCEAHPKPVLKAMNSDATLAPLMVALARLDDWTTKTLAKAADDRKDALVAARASSRWHLGTWTQNLYDEDQAIIQPGWTARYPWPR